MCYKCHCFRAPCHECKVYLGELPLFYFKYMLFLPFVKPLKLPQSDALTFFPTLSTVSLCTIKLYPPPVCLYSEFEYNHVYMSCSLTLYLYKCATLGFPTFCIGLFIKVQSCTTWSTMFICILYIKDMYAPVK